MAQCEMCGAQQDLPFTCNECGQKLCSDHRLPEAHQCPGLASDRIRFGQDTRVDSGPSSKRPNLATRLRRTVRRPVRAIKSLFG